MYYKSDHGFSEVWNNANVRVNAADSSDIGLRGRLVRERKVLVYLIGDESTFIDEAEVWAKRQDYRLNRIKRKLHHRWTTDHGPFGTPIEIFIGTLVLLGFIACLGLKVAYFSIWTPIDVGRDWVGLQATMEKSSWVRVKYTCAALVLGSALFGLRKLSLKTYAILELFTSALVCWAAFAAKPDTPGLSVALALVGGVYILVRGFDNLEKGIKQANDERLSKLSAAREKLVTALNRRPF